MNKKIVSTGNIYPQEIKMTRKTLVDIEKGVFTQEIDELIENFVVLGMPPKYY